MLASFSEVQRLSQTGLDATVLGVGEWSRGLQEIAEEIGDFAKQNVQDGTSILERLLSARSLEQALEIQTTYCQSAYESYIEQFARLGDIYAKSVKRAILTVN